MPRSARPTYSTVLKTRYWVRFGWRLLAVAIVLKGLWDARYGVMNTLTAFLEPSAILPGRSVVGALLIAPLPCVLIAVYMVIVERWLIRALVPDPYTGCARCGYPKGISTAPCPECGEAE